MRVSRKLMMSTSKRQGKYSNCRETRGWKKAQIHFLRCRLDRKRRFSCPAKKEISLSSFPSFRLVQSRPFLLFPPLPSPSPSPSPSPINGIRPIFDRWDRWDEKRSRWCFASEKRVRGDRMIDGVERLMDLTLVESGGKRTRHTQLLVENCAVERKQNRQGYADRENESDDTRMDQMGIYRDILYVFRLEICTLRS